MFAVEKSYGMLDQLSKFWTSAKIGNAHNMCFPTYVHMYTGREVLLLLHDIITNQNKKPALATISSKNSNEIEANACTRLKIYYCHRHNSFSCAFTQIARPLSPSRSIRVF